MKANEKNAIYSISKTYKVIRTAIETQLFVFPFYEYRHE